MTGYTISAGYCSEYGANSTEPWEVILEAVQSVTDKELINEYHGPSQCNEEGAYPLDMAKYMTTDQGCDSSVIINKQDQTITFLASGMEFQDK